MNERTQEIKDYTKFWRKFYQKSEEILNEYNNLSNENKRKAFLDTEKIFASYGIAGVMEFAKRMSLKNV